MSYNHPYRNPADGYGASNDKYKDSQRIYHRESTAYRSRVRSGSPERTSPSSSEPVLSSAKALSFLHSCGLDAEDLQTLAKLPEHLIAADTLPDLLAQIKKKKASGTSSSRSGALRDSSSSRSWDDTSHAQLVEYPLDLPERQSYSIPREQLPTWDDRWENVQQSSSPSCTYPSSDSNYVVEYNHLKDKESYFDKASYATEPSRQKTSVVPQSYSSYSRDAIQSSHLSSRDGSHSSRLSSRDVSQSSHLSSRDASQSSHLSSRDIGQSSHLCSRDIGQSSHLSSRDIGQSSHLSSRDIGQSSHLSSRDIGQSSHLSSRDASQSSHRSSRDVSQSSYLSSKDVSQSSHRSSRDASHSSHLSGRDTGQSSHLSSRDVGLPSLLSSRDAGPPSHLSNRGIAPPSLQSSRDVGLPSLLSIRDLAPPSHLSSRDVRQSSHHQRTESAPRVPTRKEASDFHGKTPPVFPYACVLCDITVLSNKDWSVHVKGAQHAHSQLSLVEKYPAWDQTIQSARRNEPHSDRLVSRTTQERGGTSSSRNGSLGSRSGASRSRSASSSSQNHSNTESKCKVVCVKFEVDEVDEAYLKKLLCQFGAIVKIIMLPRMAFVNMGTAGQAEDIVKYFYQNPLRIKGELIVFTLSAAVSFLQTSRVVSFSPLPSGDGIRSELTAIAKRFGSVKNSLFLPSRGYVEMGSMEEANKLVEHYSTSSLKIKGKTINVCSSTEYQTLGMKDADKERSPVPYSSRRRRRSCSPRRRTHRDSPSPKRRASEERSRSRRSQDSKKREESGRSRERTKESSKRESSYKSRSKRSSPSKDQKQETKPEESVEETVEDDNDQSDIMADDSDLEGVAVIADDGEALNSEDELTVDEEMEDEVHDTSDEQEQDASEDVQAVNESDDQTKPSDMDTSSIQPEMSEHVPTATTTTDGSSDCKEARELQQGEQKELQEEPNELQEEPKELQEEPKELQEEPTELQQVEQKELQEEPKELQQVEQKELQEEPKELQEPKDLQEKQKELQEEPKELQEEPKELQEKQKELQEEPKGLQEEPNELQEEPKELQQGEQKELENKQKVLREDQKELQEVEKKELQQNELQQGEQKGDTVEMKEEAADFSENLDKEGVLTEEGDEKEISTSSTEEKFGKVLEVAGFPVAKKYSEADLLKIGKKYGDVAGCCLVRSNRKVEKALIEMVNAADAAKLEAECKRQHIKLGGRNLRITVSKKYSQLNEGQSIDADSEKEKVKEDIEEDSKEPSSTLASSEESTVLMAEMEISEEDAEAQEGNETNMDTIMQTSSDEEETYGRVLRIRNLPMPDEYTDADFLSIVEPYGEVVRHWMFRLHQTGLIEMEKASDAEKVVAVANMNKITVAGRNPKISVSTKHAHLNKRYFLHGPSDGSLQASTEFEEENDESKTISEQPSIQTSANVKESSNDVNSKADEMQDSAADEGNSDVVTEMQTPVMDPVGTEFVRPVVGYFCSLCKAIYASEEEAKDEHCRTPMHHQKLKEHKERNSST
uniref:Matrin 3-like 1.1 n=1 Tax=Cyprinus carpio TaxID=7962 RepID=A0A8C1XSS6_CYPCA